VSERYPSFQVKRSVLEGFVHGAESSRDISGSEGGEVMSSSIDEEGIITGAERGFGEVCK
jgi:hypothetical protein